MAYYNYKVVRDQLPKWVIDAMGTDYDGDGNYDGHQWLAAAAYISFLENRLGTLNLTPTQEEINTVRQEYDNDYEEGN